MTAIATEVAQAEIEPLNAAAEKEEMQEAAPKIADLVAQQDGKPWIAFEYYPPKTEKGVANLYDRLGKMKKQSEL